MDQEPELIVFEVRARSVGGHRFGTRIFEEFCFDWLFLSFRSSFLPFALPPPYLWTYWRLELFWAVDLSNHRSRSMEVKDTREP